MKIIPYKNHQRYGAFLGWATAGTIILTLLYNIMSSDSDFLLGNTTDFHLVYYIINCILLFLMFCFIQLRYFKTYSFISCILLLSVIASLFVGAGGLTSSLFVETIILGVVFGAYYGGFIFVPMFLIAVFVSGFRGIQYFQNKIDYEKTDPVKYINWYQAK